MIVVLPYGRRQRFRARLDDITMQGRVAVAQFPIRNATWSLNGGPATPFYVDPTPDTYLRAGRSGGWFANPIDWRTSYKESPAGLRLKGLGDFCVEIPVDHSDLRVGANSLELRFEDHGKEMSTETVELEWDPTPLPVDLDLTRLGGAGSIQDIGQPVNGSFEVDAAANVIRAGTPAAPDSLLILGSPHGSQEATYAISFSAPAEAKYLGLSDWFVRNEDEAVPLGIKPGYSTAGLATIRPNGDARTWLSMGDNAHRDDGWLVMTDPPSRFVAEAGVLYRVRHQVLFGDQHTSRFRIWRVGEDEPASWLCEESDAGVPGHLPRFTQASFALFMHTGVGSEWSDIVIRSLEGE